MRRRQRTLSRSSRFPPAPLRYLSGETRTMPQAFQFDIEKLLSPISAEHPAGESLRYDGTYDKVRDARREDDASLPQGVWKTELRKADWHVVESLCTEALETRSKD